MKRSSVKWLWRAAGALVKLVLAASLFVASGIVPVNASSGHFAVTEWFLHTAMRRSVSTHSIGVQKPRALDEPWLVLKGAGHFETGCRPCHGAPDLDPPVIPGAMTPHPPFLSPTVSEWTPEQLFYIVKHGVKFTAMPAWPAQQRDDEVWSIVAFLLKMPALDARAYRELVHGDARAGDAAAPVGELVPSEAVPHVVMKSCARCHGQRGGGRGSAAFPKLAAQSESYQVAALQAYARGKRHSGMMQPIAAGLSDAQMRDLSHYYAELRPAEASAPTIPTADTERGREIATRGIPAQGVPSCMDCHGPGAHRRNSHYPKLTGQYADYLVSQLELFKSGQRGGSPYAHLMKLVAGSLSAAQMRDVARYYASLPP
jgi:cytochrome c553